MTRSGTSLLEQILSSHKKVYGAGELNYVAKFINKNFMKDEIEFNEKNSENIEIEKFKEMQNDFLKNEIIIRDTYLNKINKDTFSKNKIFVIGDSHAQDLFISLSHDNLYLKKYSKTYLPLDDSCFK